jgi:glutamate racemase
MRRRRIMGAPACCMEMMTIGSARDRRAPVGIYDSGVGGLTVWRSLRARLPHERVLYFGDTARVPYGSRPAAEILRFSQEIIGFMVAKGVKLVIAACNTSSALALPHLDHAFPISVIGMIGPAIADAVQASKTGHIGLLATEGTVQSGAYVRCLRRVAPGCRLFSQACPKLVPLIEAGHTAGGELEAAVIEYVGPLLKAGVDCIILGCTHYPLVMDTITAVAGPGVRCIDPAHAVAALAESTLRKQGLLNERGAGGGQVYVSGSVEAFRQAAKAFAFALPDEVNNIALHTPARC